MSQAQLCLTLYSPMDCSLPGSSVHGIFLLEWVATPTPGDLPNPGTNLRTMCLVRWQPDLSHCSTCEALHREKHNIDLFTKCLFYTIWEQIFGQNFSMSEGDFKLPNKSFQIPQFAKSGFEHIKDCQSWLLKLLNLSPKHLLLAVPGLLWTKLNFWNLKCKGSRKTNSIKQHDSSKFALMILRSQFWW